MKSLFIAITLLFATSLGASELHLIKDDQILNKGVQQVAQVWETLTEYSLDTGVASFSILDKEDDEEWENIIEESLDDGEYTEEIMLADVDVDLDVIKAMVEDLFESSAYLEIPRHMREIYIAGLATLLFDMVIENPNIKIYSAEQWGAFDAAYQHIVLVDTETNQMVSIYGGYSE